MDSRFAGYWEQRIKSSFDNSQWNDLASQAFESKDIERMSKALKALGETSESIAAFVKKAEKLLR